MSVDLTFTGRAVGSERVAGAWDEIEVALGPERVQRLEDQGVHIGWDDESLRLSLPFGQDETTERLFSELADTVAVMLGRTLEWDCR